MTSAARQGPIVLTTLPLSAGARRRLAEAGVGQLIVGRAGDFDPKDLEVAEIWLGPGIRPADVARAPRLRWVQAVSAGVNDFLFRELVESDTILTNARGLHAATVADHAMLLVLAFARRLPQFVRNQDRGRWRSDPDLRELEGSRMLIVGAGTIGQAIAKRAVAFGVDVRGVRRGGPPPNSGDPLFFPVVDASRLDDELRDRDWVVLAMPLTRQTRHVIGARQLESMSRTGVLVNIGRGALVDEPALIDALRSGSIAGACLDVFEEEPLPPESPLWSMPNVIVTPHVAGEQSRLQEREVDLFLDNLARYLDGRPLHNVVDKASGY